MSSDTPNGREQYFETLYKADADPWRYDTCDYEIGKRADTLSFLRPRYQNACEIGCSIGVLTEDLAPLCERITGVDVSQTAAQIARTRLKAFPHVDVRVLNIPHEELEGPFDLLVLSEVLYFLTAAELQQLAAFAQRRVIPGGDVIIVTYDGETQTQISGRSATDLFVAAAREGFDVVETAQRQDYHVRLLRRRPNAG